VQTLLKFDTLRAAVRVMEVFDSKFLSNKQNMNFVRRSFQLDKTSNISRSSSSSSSKVSFSNSSSCSTKLRNETVFIYFELKKLNKLSQIQVLVKSQKKTKTWNQSPHHTLLSSLLTYLNSTCKDTSLTAVFVCSRSAQMFHSLLQSHQPGKHFSCWADLTSCVRQQLDQNDLTSCHSWQVIAMEKIFTNLKTVETKTLQVKAGKYLIVVVIIDLLHIKVVV
jgi:hypothetical protein